MKKTWVRSDLIDLSATKADPAPSSTNVEHIQVVANDCEPNIAVLRRNDISTLYHFTDAANLIDSQTRFTVCRLGVFKVNQSCAKL